MKPLWWYTIMQNFLLYPRYNIIIIQKVQKKIADCYCWLLLLLMIYNYRVWTNNNIMHNSLRWHIIEHLSSKFSSHSRLGLKEHAATLTLISCSRATWITNYINQDWSSEIYYVHSYWWVVIIIIKEVISCFPPPPSQTVTLILLYVYYLSLFLNCAHACASKLRCTDLAVLQKVMHQLLHVYINNPVGTLTINMHSVIR